MLWAVIPAAGSGRRMRGGIPKQYLPLAGKTVLEHSMAPFLAEPRICGLVVALAADDRLWPRLAPSAGKPVYTVTGGAERADSVLAALESLQTRADDRDWVLVHDAARPCLHQEHLCRLITSLEDDAVGGILGVPAQDTLKRVDSERHIEATLDRQRVWLAQTPQMFRLGPLREALRGAMARGARVTDEAGAMELAGLHPRMVEGGTDNLKVTRPADLRLAEFLLRATQHAGDGACA